MGDCEERLQIEYDGISMKIKPILTRFGGTFVTLRFNDNLFLILYWVSRRFGLTNLPMQFMLILQVSILVIKF